MEFEAIRGPSYKADIGLDDIYFHDMPCGKIVLVLVFYRVVFLWKNVCPAYIFWVKFPAVTYWSRVALKIYLAYNERAMFI